MALYNAGRSKKTWGNVLFYGGLGLVATNLIVAMNTDNITSASGTVSYNNGSGSNPVAGYASAQSKPANMTAAIIGGAFILASIPVKIGYLKKVRSAAKKYNGSVADTDQPATTTTLIAGSNQIGVRIEF
ncbi:hypothetical protein [Flavobacterium sp. FlaQc-48]|uniref:hypothetical protein n=1 Tax=Flavobacterium sp. FlaQc-48 TaxID=3374181 RepID=UPI00375658BB